MIFDGFSKGFRFLLGQTSIGPASNERLGINPYVFSPDLTRNNDAIAVIIENGHRETLRPSHVWKSIVPHDAQVPFRPLHLPFQRVGPDFELINSPGKSVSV